MLPNSQHHIQVPGPDVLDIFQISTAGIFCFILHPAMCTQKWRTTKPKVIFGFLNPNFLTWLHRVKVN